MSLPVIFAVLGVLIVAVLAFSMRGRAAQNGASRQSAVIVVALVVVAALVLFYVFGR